MKRYGQLCPVAKAAEVFCERWVALIIRDLGAGVTSFSQLHRGVPLMSRSMLAKRLKELERENIIERMVDDNGHRCTYRLTAAGRDFLPIVQALGTWGEHWARRDLSEHESDCRPLLWEMERSVRADAFGNRRTLVQLEFIDQPSNKRRWWFLHEAGGVHLCVKDPGFEVDLYLSATLADMMMLWRGGVALSTALRTGCLRAQGASCFRRALTRWLGRGSVAALDASAPRRPGNRSGGVRS